MSLGVYARAELIVREAARRFESPELAQLADEAHAASVAQPRPERPPLPATETSHVEDAPDRLAVPSLQNEVPRASPAVVPPFLQSNPPSPEAERESDSATGPVIPRRPAARPARSLSGGSGAAAVSKVRLVGGLAVAVLLIVIALSRRGGSTPDSTPTLAENRPSQSSEVSTVPSPAPETATPQENRPPPTVPEPPPDVKPVVTAAAETPRRPLAPLRPGRSPEVPASSVSSSETAPRPAATAIPASNERQPAEAPHPPERLISERRLIERRFFAEAIAVLVELQKDNPGDTEVAALLARANDERRTAIEQALAAASSSESAGDWPAALQHYEQVRQLDPSAATLAQSVNRVRARMKTEGADAYVRARQYDAVDRVSDAIAWYERAYRNLLDDDPRRMTATERLAALRARPQ
jgi:hypothetical protein